MRDELLQNTDVGGTAKAAATEDDSDASWRPSDGRRNLRTHLRKRIGFIGPRRRRRISWSVAPVRGTRSWLARSAL
jgi:hypothetical protein